MVAGTYIFTDTIAKAFGGIIASSYANTSAVVSGTAQTGSGAAGVAGVPAGLLADVRALPEVEAAAGGSLDLDQPRPVTVTGTDGRRLAGGPDASLGLGVDPADSRFNPLELTSGRWAAGHGELVVDVGTAQRQHLAVGTWSEWRRSDGRRRSRSPGWPVSARFNRWARPLSRLFLPEVGAGEAAGDEEHA